MRHSYSKTQLDKALVAERKAMRKRQKQSLFMRKTLNIFRGMENRANGLPFDFTLDDLRELCGEALSEGTCRYCKGSLRLTNLAVDHVVPIARGGDPGSFLNVMPSCKSCNWQKGVMTGDEFTGLLSYLLNYTPEVQADIKRRLTIGGKWSFGK